MRNSLNGKLEDCIKINNRINKLSFTYFRSPTPKLQSRTPKILKLKSINNKL